MIKRSIGQLCREAREVRGLTQDDTAALTHYDRRTISDYERDRRTEGQFRYACRRAEALGDMNLFRAAIAIETGVPIAGSPVPDGIDRHIAALRDLAMKEKREAWEALAQIPVWQVGPERRAKAERAAEEVLDSIIASGWVYQYLCALAEIDPYELMRRRRLPAVA